MSLSDRLEKLQNQPYETRLRVLWGIVIVCAIALLLVWIFSLKNTFGNVDTKNLIQAPAASGTASSETATQFAAVERVEQTQGILKIYFNITNPTDDILNFSKLDSISLVTKNNTVQAQTITDRQGQAFVQKILSHTQNFGILTFTGVNDNSGSLVFDQMFLENNASNLFKQSLNLDFTKLNQQSNLRN